LLDADSGLGTLEQVEGELTEGVEVSRRVGIPDAAVTFVEGDIEDPVEPILNPPVAAHGVGECLDLLTLKGRDVIPAFM